MLVLHDEVYGVAPLAAAEALEDPLGGGNGERGCLLVMERTETSMLTPLRFSDTNSETTSVICAASKIRSMVEWSIMGG